MTLLCDLEMTVLGKVRCPTVFGFKGLISTELLFLVIIENLCIIFCVDTSAPAIVL